MFYNFNAQKKPPKSPGKPECRASRSIISRITSLQRWRVMFTHICTDRFAKILLKITFVNLVGACVLFCMLLIFDQRSTTVLPVYDRISIPMLPDQFEQPEDLQHQTDFELYLDSLQRAFHTDSINDTRTINN